ncbi:MAG: hypothetical protein Q7K43_06910, partial [Candidatus Woesearchaeota archaeon]|nr:hypothetical protein [Candidatus Woesearchaeota archaeon]
MAQPGTAPPWKACNQKVLNAIKDRWFPQGFPSSNLGGGVPYCSSDSVFCMASQLVDLKWATKTAV